VEEQSHKSEMRAALQGDFERLRARRQSGVSETVSEHSRPDIREVEVSAPLPVPAVAPPSWLDRIRGIR
jgi:hypothetical protein